jgi:hypothetical protein
MMHLTYYDVDEREEEERKLMFCLKGWGKMMGGGKGVSTAFPQSELRYERSARERHAD